jgi:hypothetical protein
MELMRNERVMFTIAPVLGGGSALVCVCERERRVLREREREESVEREERESGEEK